MPGSPAVARFLCFGVIGGTTTAVYAVFAWLAAALLGLAAPLASLAAYALAASLSYVGHRLLTFGDAVPNRNAGARFTLIAILGYLAALVIPTLVTSVMGAPIEVAILATCLAVPLMSYPALSRFVFDGRSEGGVGA
jgi:putative flippase GtrA